MTWTIGVRDTYNAVPVVGMKYVLLTALASSVLRSFFFRLTGMGSLWCQHYIILRLMLHLFSS